MIPNILLLAIQKANGTVTNEVFNAALYMQMDYRGNEFINPVTETFANVSGTPTIVDSKLSTALAADYIASETVLIDSGDFTIQTKFNYVSSGTNLAIIGVWTDLSSGQWSFLWKADENLMCFYFRNSGGVLTRIAHYMAKPTTNVDHHIAVCRSGSTTYLLYDGVVLTTSTAIVGGNANPVNVEPIMQIGNGSSFNGKRWDTQFIKGTALYTGNYTVPQSIPAVGRDTYDQATSDLIVCQLDGRRDSIINDANGLPAAFTSVSIKNSKIKTTSSSSSIYSIPIRKFGAGDFTIEFKCNYSSRGTSGTMILAQWQNGIVTHDNNRYIVGLIANGTPYIGVARSASGSDNAVAYGPSALQLNKTYHIVVERVAGVLRVYIDGVSGTPTSYAGAIRGEAPFVASNFIASDPNFGSAGAIWDIRIVDKAMYNGIITQVPQFPKLISETYAPAVASDILAQCTFRNNNSRNEKTQDAITIAGTGIIQNGALVTTQALSSRYYIPAISIGGATNFTLECRFIVKTLTTSATTPIVAQWRGDTNQNSWAIWQRNDGKVGFTVAASDGNGATGYAYITSLSAITLGREYHIVTERVGSTITLYLDGVVQGTTTHSAVLANSNLPLTNVYEVAPAQLGANKVWDIRIAKCAMYNGVITSKQFPKFTRTQPKPSLTIGTGVTGTGSAQGFMQNLMYGITPYVSIGGCTHVLFKDIRVPAAPVTVRLLGIWEDRGSYTVLTYAPCPDIVPTDDMPIFTNSLKVGSAAPLLITNGVPASAAGPGVIARYWGTTVGLGGVVGKALPFEFL